MGHCAVCGTETTGRFCPQCGAAMAAAPGRARWMPALGFLAIPVLAGAVLLDPTPARPQTHATISSPIITDRVNPQSREPEHEMPSIPSDTPQIYAAVEADLKKGTDVAARWFFNGRHLADADFQTRLDRDFRGWIAPSVTRSGAPWPPARYTVRFYVDGREAAAREFEVK